MAFLPDPQDQTQQQNQQQSQVPTVPQIPTLQGTSGPSAGSGAGAQSGVTNTASPAAAPSTPWQNITTYLNANAGQAGNVAGTVAQNLQGQYNQANQAIGQENQNFGQQIESNRIPLDQNMTQQAATAPGQFVQNPANVTAFQNMLNGSYKGPQNFSGTSDFSNLQGQVQAAQKNAALVNQGTSGIQTLLQQAESANGQNPTPGITSLDALLLQEDPSNFATLRNAAAPFSGLTSYLGQTQQGLDTAAQNAAQEAAGTRQAVQSQFTGPGGVVPSFQNKVNSGLQSAVKQGQTYNQQVSDILSSLSAGKALTPDLQAQIDPGGALQALNPYGTSTGVFQNMLAEGFPGVSPGILAQFYNAPNQLQTPTTANTMSPQEWADANALNQLLGQNAVPVPSQLGTPFSVPGSLGTYNDQDALQALYGQIQSDGSLLPQMSPEQQAAYLADAQQLGSWLGIPNAGYPTPTPLPTNAPAPTLPTLGGGLPGSGYQLPTSSGGGIAAR